MRRPSSGVESIEECAEGYWVIQNGERMKIPYANVRQANYE